MISRLECTRVHFVQVSVLISRPEVQGLGLGLETWRPRSRSWSQDSMLGAYACSTITVICSTFKRVLGQQLELMQPVMWFRDHDLETRVHLSSFCPGLCLGLETWWPRRDHDLETRVHLSSFCPGLGLGLETWSPRSRSWSRDLKRSWQQHCAYSCGMDIAHSHKTLLWCSTAAAMRLCCVIQFVPHVVLYNFF